MKFLRIQGIHRAWIILAAACVLGVVSRADSASFAVLVDPLVEKFGWKRGDIGLAYSLAFLCSMPAMLVFGWLGDRYSARTLMLGSSLMISVGTVMLGMIQELWHLHVIYGVFVGALGNAAFVVLLPVIITRWFNHKMGLALGIYWAGLGMGPVVFALLFRWMIENRGWEPAFMVFGIAFGVVLLFFSWFIRSSPAEMGLTAYGADEADKEKQASGPTVSLKSVFSSRPVWLLMGCHHLGCAGHAVILAHGVSMATHHGIPGLQAAGVLSTIAGVSIFSRFSFSLLTERFGGRTILSGAIFGQSLSVLMLLFASEAWHFYIFAVIFGICYGGEMVGFPIINRQMFGPKAPLSSIFSFQMIGGTTGMALGGWLGGALFDHSGNYTAAILVASGIGFLAVPLALWLPRHRHKAVAQV
ncbi:MAG: MFS transporter [Burkholderiales bacterium]|jgi:MFS family permease|nr:MFS transporter [Burkholderiales bacterium]